MRLLIVPIILIAILVQIPAIALANNQEAASRIAGAIGNQFPSADIDVAFQGGQVWLRGEVTSQEQHRGVLNLVRNFSGVNSIEGDEIRVVVPRVAPALQAQVARPASPVANPALINPAPVPTPNVASAQQANAQPRAANPVVNQANQRLEAPTTTVTASAAHHPQGQPQVWSGAMLPPHPQQHFPAAYGVRAGHQVAPMPPNVMPIPMGVHQAMPQNHAIHHHAFQQQAMMQQPMMHGHHGQMHGQMPGQFNQLHLPDYAWPAYANWPNFGQVSYPRSFAPNAWPYIGPFYPYPQVPLGWRKVTLEHSNGWWWLDFDDGTSSGPFSALFRHPMQYTY